MRPKFSLSNLIFLAVCSAAVHFAMAGFIWAGSITSINATVIVTGFPIEITERAKLRFGVIRRGGGSVTVTATNKRFATASIELNNGFDFGRAEFQVRGRPNSSYMIHVRPSMISEPDQSNTASPRVVDLVTYSTTVGSETMIGRFGEDGTDFVYVGGTLLVRPTITPGMYQSEIQITVSYE